MCMVHDRGLDQTAAVCLTMTTLEYSLQSESTITAPSITQRPRSWWLGSEAKQVDFMLWSLHFLHYLQWLPILSNAIACQGLQN